MSTDFFLINRCHQVTRLCQDGNSPFSIPVGKARSKSPQELREFYDLLDAFRGISEVEQGESLSSEQRRMIEHFERTIVRLRFASQPAIKEPAVQLIKAIFADAAYFSGLKPIAQYTEAFAYELLFPSWLNLLKACMMPQASNNKPRLNGASQAVLFEFLGGVHTSKPACEENLIGFLTLIASRNPGPRCEELLQRFVELYALEGPRLIDAISRFELLSKDGRQFTQWLSDYLTVRHSLSKWPSKSEYPIASARPPIRALPKALVLRLDELEQTGVRWQEYFNTARLLTVLIYSDNFLVSEFVDVLDTNLDHAVDLLGLVIWPEGEAGSGKVLNSDGQVCLAQLIEALTVDGGDLPIAQLQSFASTVAIRMEGFSESTIDFFRRRFIKDAKNRGAVLDACNSDSQARRLASTLTQRARATDDETRFLNLLACATLFSPDEDHAQARAGLQAIEAVVANRSIGSREFSDLVGDLFSNSDSAITYLASPLMATRGKPPRLATLYMTLNEIAETYASSGKADNFSVVRAKYVRLMNHDLDGQASV